MPPPAPWQRIGGLILLGALLHARAAGAADPVELGCDRVVRPALAEALHAEISALPRPPGCEYVGLSTQTDVCEVRLAHAGAPEEPLIIAPRGCLPGPTHRGPVVDGRIPPTLAPACAELARGVGAVVERFSPGVSLQRGSLPSGAIRALVVAAVLLTVLAALGAWRRASLRAGLAGALGALGIGGLALATRLAVEPGMANWYLEVVPYGAGRFGPAALALQHLVGWVVPLDDRALFTLTSALGALSVVVSALLAWRLSGSWVAAAASGAFLALTPLHLRVSASGAEHVLASLASLAAVLLWTEATVSGRLLPAAASLVTAAVAALTRLDALAFLALTPLWPLAARLVPWGRRAALAAAGWWAAWLSLAAFTVVTVAIPARHPAPELEAVLRTLRILPGSYLEAAGEIGWIPGTALGFALVGLVALGLRRRALLALVVVSLLVVHGAVARDWTEGMLVGRYLLSALALLCLLAGFGVEAAARVVPALPGHRLARPVVLAAAAVGLALVLRGESRRAASLRYAFQDEYSFLRRELKVAPAGCAVGQLTPRQDAFARDLDCCLDAPRSPLTLAFPELAFVSLHSRDDLATLARDRPCTLYYEGVICEVPRHGTTEPMDAPTVAWLDAHCEQALSGLEVTPLAGAEVASLTTARLFPQRRPRVQLYRVRPR